MEQQQQQQQTTTQLDHQVIRIEVHHYHCVPSTVATPASSQIAPFAVISENKSSNKNNNNATEQTLQDVLVHGAVVRIACNGRLLCGNGFAAVAVPKTDLSKDAISTSQWTVHVMPPTPKQGQLHAFKSVATGRFLRVCKDGTVDCKGKEGGRWTLFKVNSKGRSLSLKSVATGLFLDASSGSVTSSPTASYVRVRPSTTIRATKPQALPGRFRRDKHLVIKLHPAPTAAADAAAGATANPVVSNDVSNNKKERFKLKQERIQQRSVDSNKSEAMSKEERFKLKQERIQQRIEKQRAQQRRVVVDSNSNNNNNNNNSNVAFPVGSTVTLMPKAFLEMPNRSQQKGWHLGIAPEGFVVADAADGPWSHFAVLSAGKGANVIFESLHTPAWHLAVRHGQLTHKGGKGLFARFVAKRHDGDWWSFRCAADDQGFLAVSTQGVLHVAKEENPQTTLFKLNVVV